MKTNALFSQITFSTILSTMLVAPAWSQENLIYQVKKGDTVGEILASLGICPVWGKNNALAKTVAINRDVLKKNGNFVRPGKKIRLPVTSLPEHQDYQISPDGEVRFLTPTLSGNCLSGYIAQNRSDEQTREITSTTPPTEIPTETKEEDSEAHGNLRVSTDIFYTSFDMTDSLTKEKAQINSRVNHAYQVAWEQQWDKNNHTFLFFRTEKQAYEAVADRMPTQSFNLNGFGFGYQKKMSERFDVKMSALAQERLFARSTNVVNLMLDRAMVTSLSVTPIYKFYSKGPFSLSADFGLGYLLSGKTSNYSIKSGYNYRAGLLLTQEIKDFVLFGRSYYGVENQDSSISQKTMKELGISAGLSWSFGK